MTNVNSNLCFITDSYRFGCGQLILFLDSLGALVENFVRRLLWQLQEAASQLDFNGWAIVMVVLLTCGWFFLRGEKIRGA